jgi:hypothetical protein
VKREMVDAHTAQAVARLPVRGRSGIIWKRCMPAIGKLRPALRQLITFVADLVE